MEEATHGLSGQEAQLNPLFRIAAQAPDMQVRSISGVRLPTPAVPVLATQVIPL